MQTLSSISIMYNWIVSGGSGNKSNRRGQWNTMDEVVVIPKFRPLSMILSRCMDWLGNLEWRK
jgi:hypothetical protein